jgi:hypothetical protein
VKVVHAHRPIEKGFIERSSGCGGSEEKGHNENKLAHLRIVSCPVILTRRDDV